MLANRPNGVCGNFFFATSATCVVIQYCQTIEYPVVNFFFSGEPAQVAVRFTDAVRNILIVLKRFVDVKQEPHHQYEDQYRRDDKGGPDVGKRSMSHIHLPEQ